MNMFNHGIYTNAQPCHSPNFEPRPADSVISLIVIHNISLPPFEYGSGCIDKLFQNQLDKEKDAFLQSIAHLRVSSHFLIERDGLVKQFVSVNDMAYHAGVSCFRGQEKCNHFSIGIELEGCDFEPFTAQQYNNLLILLKDLIQAYPTITAICGHSDIAPNRKTDPGHFFDWQRLIDAGLPVDRNAFGFAQISV